MIPAKGKIPKSLAEAQKVTKSCQKTQGCAAADIFGLGNPEEWLGRKAKQQGHQSQDGEGEGREVGRMCRERVERQEGYTGFNYSSHFIISPLNMMHTPPPILLLASKMFKVPQQLMLEARDGEASIPLRSGYPPLPFSSCSLGSFQSLHKLGCDPSVILLSFLQMATCGL